MARMDFGDLDFDFSCEINPNEFDQIEEKFFGMMVIFCENKKEL